MKILIAAIALLALMIVQGNAQSNSAPARLAIIVEDSSVANLGDLLTAALSTRTDLQLLERTEVEKVYREQALSQGNRNYLHLGQILGADGLLLLNAGVAANPIASSAMALQFGAASTRPILESQLIAVKPGVLLLDERLSLPNDLSQWAARFANHLSPLLPKLSVLAKEAVAISVVNLRSSLQSSEARDLEAQLTALTIERLSHERQLFVLERRNMQLLTPERERIGLDDTAFWNGSLLLDGTIDRDGYSKDKVTLNVRLVPRKGGAPTEIEVSGSRGKLAEVVDQLAIRIIGNLKLHSSVTTWNSADEARRYFEEATWALKWKLLRQAQAASESAWALGKQDLECALARVKCYVEQIPDILPPGTERANLFTNEKLNYVHIDDAPNPQDIDRALRALALYEQFSRSSPDGEPKVLSRGPNWHDWHDSEWYELGIGTLIAGSRVLQHFNFFDSNLDTAQKLSELRAAARSVGSLIAKAPSVRESYFVGERLATHDELAHTLEEAPNIFSCAATWGCFWQDQPEDTLALYRELMSSPAFCYIHTALWDRKKFCPRLVAWNEASRIKIPALWENFVRELNASTNILLQMEAKALARADAKTGEQTRDAEAEWWKIVRAHREELVGYNVELFYLGWHFISTPETAAMDREYWDKTVPAAKTIAVFDAQKRFLAEFTPYNFSSFTKLFSELNYSKAQAAEILPLIVAYKSNLVARASEREKFRAQSNARSVAFFVEKRVNEILNPSALKPGAAPAAQPVVSGPVKTPAPTNSAIATNIIAVKSFLPIPLAGLEGSNISQVRIVAHHWQEQRLVLDFQYQANFYSFDADGNWQSTSTTSRSAIALLDLATSRWIVIGCPETEILKRNPYYHHTILWRGELFNSDNGAIRRYDARNGRWEALQIADLGNCALFVVNDHLYAANQTMICEILSGGKGTRILASNRRQPAASALDAKDLGTPSLFPGPTNSLRVSTANEIWTWSGADWRKDSAVPSAAVFPLILPDGVLFRNPGEGLTDPVTLWFLGTEATFPELCLTQAKPIPSYVTPPAIRRPAGELSATPTSAWKMPSSFTLSKLPAVMARNNLYLLADHSEMQDIVDQQQNLIVGRKHLTQNGYHAALLCFAPDLQSPQTVFLRFDSQIGSPPVEGANRRSLFFNPMTPSTWMLASTDQLIFGTEIPNTLTPSGGSSASAGQEAGIWLAPLSQIESARQEQKIIQRDETARELAAIKTVGADFLARYDRNRNGRIDADEKEAALNESQFITAELDKIDANRNGWLGANETAYFDANENGVLEPAEQTGIETAQHLLAERRLKQFDTSEDGYLERAEFDALWNSFIASSDLRVPGILAFPDRDHDGRVDLPELESLMAERLRSDLRGLSSIGPPMLTPMRPPASHAEYDRATLKVAVESYWRNHNRISSQTQDQANKPAQPVTPMPK